MNILFLGELTDYKRVVSDKLNIPVNDDSKSASYGSCYYVNLSLFDFQENSIWEIATIANSHVGRAIF